MPLFAFGSNGSGQLGLGHEEDVSVPARCVFEFAEDAAQGEVDAPKGGDVVRIVAGGNHTLVLDRRGRVFAAGWNGDGRCGIPKREEGGEGEMGEGDVPNAGGGGGRVYDTFTGVAATWEGTVLVASEEEEEEGQESRDRVFVLGSGLKGELGLGKGCLRASAGGVAIPDFPPQGMKVRAVASGMGHTVVVLSDGSVWAWGAARKGQLGEANIPDKVVWRPRRIEGSEGLGFRATGAACGREFTVIIGDPARGEFTVLGAVDDKWGIRSGVSASQVKEKALRAGGYRAIEVSWHGVYVHLDDGEVVAWGRNDRGQIPWTSTVDLGHGKVVRDLAAGSEHLLARLDERTVVACGWGEHGNCGPDTDAQGNVKGKWNRIPLPDGESDIVGVGAGCATSWIITA
ncbi:alpha-tubulin suppressor protein Aats1 [Aspergillus japonicus CBS 114.51]|uniref:Alpha-tubulin suppressor protein Aats1 n=1 Tax=Aspergillus japonicus CBS 114.51 TaxID=1448312 RepID=A0A8T8WJY7_ASPJA|nr:alpha-tubulin suppressor protein Aats1 [Aspergillus japonicus CBS 114.51]RAH76023.1 alpha-tubulin suppressor protein Aats1 [Aspergillus japonicus CBS 114.51]